MTQSERLEGLEAYAREQSEALGVASRVQITREAGALVVTLPSGETRTVVVAPEMGDDEWDTGARAYLERELSAVTRPIGARM